MKKKGETVASHGPTNTLVEAAKAGARLGGVVGARVARGKEVGPKRPNLTTSRKRERRKSAPAKDWLKKPI